MSIAQQLATVPQLTGRPLMTFLLQVAVLLLLAHLLARLAAGCRLPAVVGELFAGVLVGPSVLGAMTPHTVDWLLPTAPERAHLFDGLAQLGAVLLVGITGAQLDHRVLRLRRGTALRVSLLSLLVPLGFGIGFGFAMPGRLLAPHAERFTAALFLGVAMCVSALPVIGKILSDMRMLHRDVGQLILTSATVDDAAGWVLLSVVSALALGSSDPWRLTRSLLSLLAMVLIALTVGRPVVHRLLRLLATGDDPGRAIAPVVVLLLLGAGTAQWLGLEPVFGAFLVGVLVGRPGVVEPARLAPLRTLTMSVLAPIFLTDVGLRVDLTTLLHPTAALTALAVTVLAVVGKLLGAYLGARLSRLGHIEAVAIGAGLNARGVIGFVVASAGLRLGVLTTTTYTVIVLVALVTSMMAPPMLRWTVGRLRLTEAERYRQIELAAWLPQLGRTTAAD